MTLLYKTKPKHTLNMIAIMRRETGKQIIDYSDNDDNDNDNESVILDNYGSRSRGKKTKRHRK